MDIYQNLAWKDFNDAHPTEQHCLEELIKRMIEGSWIFKCRKCDSLSIYRNWGERKYKCTDCGNRGWFLAGSFFEFIRHARLWLGCIWLIERGVYVNAWQFHRLSKCAYSTALAIFKKLAFVIYENLDDESDTTESEQFKSIFWKRSNQTPIGEHPITEQDAYNNESEQNQSSVEIDKLLSAEKEKTNQLLEKLGKNEKIVYEYLTEERIHLDHIFQNLGLDCGELLTSLTILELDKLILRHGGDYYSLPVLKEKNNSKSNTTSLEVARASAQPIIDGFIDFVKCTIHGISRKYLQIYLAAFWSKYDRSRWGVGKLIEACCNSAFRSMKQVSEYITPNVVLLG